MSGEHIINVLEPKSWDENGSPEDSDAPQAFRQTSKLSQHISFLKDFFRTYKDFTDRQIDVIEIMLQKLSPKLYQALGIYLPLITTNCAVLGAATINADSGYTVLEATVFGLCSGIGFALALLLFSSLRERLDVADVPKPFQGTPIALVTAGILAMAFVGFSGLC